MQVTPKPDPTPPQLPVPVPLPRPGGKPARRAPLVPERSDFLEGDEPAAAKVEAFLAKALAADPAAADGPA